jgi:MCM AAA-lid domain
MCNTPPHCARVRVCVQRAMVECYRALRQNDSLGRNRAAYRITVRQLESMVRLSEALARLHLDDEVGLSYQRSAGCSRVCVTCMAYLRMLCVHIAILEACSTLPARVDVDDEVSLKEVFVLIRV